MQQLISSSSSSSSPPPFSLHEINLASAVCGANDAGRQHETGRGEEECIRLAGQ